MVSLSTVYVVSIILASIAGMGSAFVGNKIYPIQGGAEPVVEKQIVEEPESVVEEPKEEEEQVPQLEEQKSDLSGKIAERFNVDNETADIISQFVEVPVSEWKKIADSPGDLKRKFVRTMTHPDRNQCPKELLDLCKIVYVKYSNMKSYIDGDTFTPYGDQTSEALHLLASTE